MASDYFSLAALRSYIRNQRAHPGGHPFTELKATRLELGHAAKQDAFTMLLADDAERKAAV